MEVCPTTTTRLPGPNAYIESESNEAPHDHSGTVTVTVTWDGPNDSQDPLNWPQRKKWSTIALGLCVSFMSAMNGTIITVAHQAINQDFHISDTNLPNSYWPTTSWGLGSAVFPLVLFPIMEHYGVRPVLLSTYFVFTCFLIPVGLAQNFATLIVVRFFTGGCVQLLCNAVAGIITNVFDEDRVRSIPIALYVTTYLSGTSLGPVIGAAIFRHLSWHWIAYIELIWTAVLFPIFMISMPESRSSAILQAKTKRLRQNGIEATTAKELANLPPWYQIIKKSVQRPVYMLLTEPVVAVAALWAAFILGTIYLFTQSVEQVYGKLYGWTAVQAGYIQGAIVVGQILGCGLCIKANDWYYSSASRNTEVPGTGARLYASIIGGFCGATGGMLVYGGTSYQAMLWVVPTVGLAMVGFGTASVVVSIAI